MIEIETWSNTTEDVKEPRPFDPYKPVKNIIHNELKLTREDLLEMMRPMVEDLIKKAIHDYVQECFNQYDFDRAVTRIIRDFMTKDHSKPNDPFTSFSFDRYLGDLFRGEVRKAMMNKYEFFVKISEHDQTNEKGGAQNSGEV